MPNFSQSLANKCSFLCSFLCSTFLSDTKLHAIVEKDVLTTFVNTTVLHCKENLRTKRCMVRLPKESHLKIVYLVITKLYMI
jgi:hypothetical protein